MPRVPALVGIHEIGELAGVTRQRAYQMTSNLGFPAPVAELKCGRIWREDEVRRYLAGRRTSPTRVGEGSAARPGRKDASGAAVGDRTRRRRGASPDADPT